MDDVLNGLNRIIIEADSAYSGKTVTISSGSTLLASATLDSNSKAVMFIPSIPAPLRETYTVAIGTDWTDTIDVGCGDTVTVYPNYALLHNKDKIATYAPIQISHAAGIHQISHMTSGVGASTYGGTGGTIENGGSFIVPRLTVNETGHITYASNQNITLPYIDGMSGYVARYSASETATPGGTGEYSKKFTIPTYSGYTPVICSAYSDDNYFYLKGARLATKTAAYVYYHSSSASHTYTINLSVIYVRESSITEITTE